MTDDQFQQTALDDLIPDDGTPPQAPKPVEVPPEPVVETGDQDADTPQDAPPASDPKPAPRMVPVAALEDERRKRQELEQYLYQLSQQQPQQPQQPEEDPNDIFWGDPVGLINSTLQEATTRLQREHQFEIFQTRAELSREVMASRHEDYEDVEAVFLQAVDQDPSLAAKLGQSKNPAKFAYEEGLKLRQLQDPDAYRARIEAEILAKYGIQLGQQPGKKSPSPPPSLAMAPSAPMSTTEGYSGPTPLANLIPD